MVRDGQSDLAHAAVVALDVRPRSAPRNGAPLPATLTDSAPAKLAKTATSARERSASAQLAASPPPMRASTAKTLSAAYGLDAEALTDIRAHTGKTSSKTKKQTKQKAVAAVTATTAALPSKALVSKKRSKATKKIKSATRYHHECSDDDSSDSDFDPTEKSYQRNTKSSRARADC